MPIGKGRQVYVAALRIELRIRGARSLKEKRHIVKSVIAQVTGTFGVAAAEVEDQDKWQKATIGVAAVAPQHGHLVRILHSVERYIDGRHDVELLRVATSFLEAPE